MLPFGHLTVDCVVLALWLWHAHTLYHPTADLFPSRTTAVRFFQEGGSVAFDPKFISPPEFLLLASGTLPAMLVSTTVRP
jgi:hypothetical protein